MNWRRLTSPVSGSCCAVCVSSSSALLALGDVGEDALEAGLRRRRRRPSAPDRAPTRCARRRAGSGTRCRAGPSACASPSSLITRARSSGWMRCSHSSGSAIHCVRAEAEHRLDLRAHVEAAPGRARLPAIRGDRHALEQRAEALFAEVLGGGVIHEVGAHARRRACMLLSAGAALRTHARMEGGLSCPRCGALRAHRLRLRAARRRARRRRRSPARSTASPDAQIAERFAPRLVLHADERYAPTSADELLALGATLVDRDGGLVRPAPLTRRRCRVGSSCVGGLPVRLRAAPRLRTGREQAVPRARRRAAADLRARRARAIRPAGSAPAGSRSRTRACRIPGSRSSSSTGSTRSSTTGTRRRAA